VSCLALFQTTLHRSVIPYVPAAATAVGLVEDVGLVDDDGLVDDVGLVEDDGGFVVGGFVVGGFVVGGRVVGGRVVGDFDAVGFPVVAPTITPGPTPPNVLTGCETPVDGLFAWVADAVGVWVVTMVLFPLFPGVLPLLEISTAMIATMPMAAAPIPANKKVRDPVPRGDGIRWASFW
jgi:hypothetical protein